MSLKIVIIGGGSVLWMPRLAADLFLEPSLNGSEMRLVDIDLDALNLTSAYLAKMNDCLQSRWTIRKMTEDDALPGADCVVVSISTGGFEAMALDYGIPEKYGIYHTVGDTVGPGGIARSIRNIPVFLKIAEKMARLCPNAPMVHVTNPLNQLTRAVCKQGLVQCIGLCHEFTAALAGIRDFFHLGNDSDADAVCQGVNHFTVMSRLTCKGIENPMSQLTVANFLKYAAERTREATSNTVDDEVKKSIAYDQQSEYIRFWLCEKTGNKAFPAAGSQHFCENLPGFNHDLERMKAWHLIRKGVLPTRPQGKKKRADTLRNTLEKNETPPEIAKRSAECLADVIVGLFTGETRRVIATIPNVGQIDNLPRETVVETWAMTGRSGVMPLATGAVIEPWAGMMRQVVTEEELTVSAAMEHSRDALIAAMVASPMVADKTIAPALADDYLTALATFLPEYH